MTKPCVPTPLVGHRAQAASQVKSEACLDAAEHDGSQAIDAMHATSVQKLGGSLVRQLLCLSRTFAVQRKCATEEMSVVFLALSVKARKNSVVCFRKTIEWE